MTFSLDSKVKFCLQQHLVNAHQGNADALQLGTQEQLEVVSKIATSVDVSQCFSYSAWERYYPELPKGGSLVALVDRGDNVHVVAIYSLQQMHRMDALRQSGSVRGINWRVLEIPEELKDDLLKEVSLEDGLIFSPLETMLNGPA